MFYHVPIRDWSYMSEGRIPFDSLFRLSFDGNNFVMKIMVAKETSGLHTEYEPTYKTVKLFDYLKRRVLKENPNALDNPNTLYTTLWRKLQRDMHVRLTFSASVEQIICIFINS